MTLARPKRKAAGNKNYLDAIPEAMIEEIVEKPPLSPRNSSKKRNSTAASSKSTSPGSVTPKPQSGGKVPYNWQPPISNSDIFSNKLNLAGAFVDMRTQLLTCPEQLLEPFYLTEEDELKHLGTLINQVTGHIPKTRKKLRVTSFQLKKGDYIYMVSEPPGEPYYVGRIMGFKRKVKGESDRKSEIEDAKNYVFEIQWFYRPRDISKNTSDSRLLFASMHSDTCPLSSFRGRVMVKHRLDVEAFYTPPTDQTKYTTAVEYYSSFPNCFYFDKLFDRYMIKFYDIIKTSTLLCYVDNAANNSKHYLLALNKRFEFVFMEASRTKQFINNFHSTSSSHCDICAEWCSSSDSVACGGCAKHFHMLCLDPPLLKKPSRGFSWSCAACTKKHEIEHQSKKILMLAHDNRTTNEQEILEILEISESLSPKDDLPERKSPEAILPKFECAATEFLQNDADLSVEDRRLQEEWSLRYLGIHTRLEDAVDLDDRSPYPRACTNLGAKYQALNIPEFEDHPIVYYDLQSNTVSSSKAKKGPGGRKITKRATVEEDTKKLPVPQEYEGVSPKEFPQWLQPRPKGYMERGVDDGDGQTCTLMWKPREEDKAEDFKTLDSYIEKCKPIAERLEMSPNSPNFMDAIVKYYNDNGGNVDIAFALADKLTRSSLREPTLSKEEIKRFEAGIKKYGSELYPTFKEVKTQPCPMVVRYYYLWKKTKKGRQIWGSFPGRKRKSQKDGKSEMKVLPAVDEFADSDDDSAYENEKIIKHQKLFRCKHCKSYQSQYWFKITGFDGTTKYEESAQADDIDPETVTALCCRCAKLWRRYAVYWEDPFEVERKNARGIGGYKKKVESELVADAERILKLAEADGGNLSYDSNKQNCSSSVILPSNTKLGPGTTDFFTRTEFVAPPPPQKKRAPKTPAKTPKSTAKATPKSASKESPTTARLTSRQLSISSKQEEEKKEDPREVSVNGTSRKRKIAENGTTIVKTEKVEKVPPPAKKPRLAAKKTTKSTKNTSNTESTTTTKRKRKTPDHTEKPAALEHTATKSTAPKRQKKNSQEFFFLNPILNPNYRSSVPKSPGGKDAPQFAKLNHNVLEHIVCNFKLRQLSDLRQIAYSVSNPLKMDLPFYTFERDCCICLEHDDRAESIQEMLICSNCGVNVHASCAGIALLGKLRPIMQWMCEPCVNDLSPQYSTTYLCCVCLANEQHTEMSILGSPKARPDYLMPVMENMKWCHLLCALFTYNETSFRNVNSPPFFAKDTTHAFYWRPMTAVIESVSKLFIDNRESHCGICNIANGAMIKCDMCDESETKYHLTCAQDTAKYKLGFKLVPQKASRAAGIAYIGDQLGRLEPILVCPKHELKNTVYELRSMGSRTQSSEQKPLISLFIEDLVKASMSKLSGPQLRAYNYVTMVDKYMLQQNPVLEATEQIEDSKPKKYCEVCSIKSSPKWWPIEGSKGVQCQNCFKLGEDENHEITEGEGDVLARELNEPLSGTNFGISGPSDHIRHVYQPTES
ncbi:CIC11C00000004798 [Sungouiella intermedia]|uniref:CIC11C00000004798 n=1 Tax=Sungouiella intermedia TaxID=45354 RepID=A0A1L0BJB1_9ASCO|nr:CIC11C00000004798 [[Candida] intermedia]